MLACSSIPRPDSRSPTVRSGLPMPPGSPSRSGGPPPPGNVGGSRGSAPTSSSRSHSPSDDRDRTRRKMVEYLEQGARLGWYPRPEFGIGRSPSAGRSIRSRSWPAPRASPARTSSLASSSSSKASSSTERNRGTRWPSARRPSKPGIKVRFGLRSSGLEIKRAESLATDVRGYWIIDRSRRIMSVYRNGPEGVATLIIEEADSCRTDLLPGFVLPISRLLARADDWPPRKRTHAPQAPRGRTSLMVKIRRAYEVLFLGLFLFFLLITDLRYLKGWPVSLFLEATPLVALATALTTHTLYRNLVWGLVVIAITMMLGRVWCNWMCPFGILHHFFGWIGNRRNTKQMIEVNRIPQDLRDQVLHPDRDARDGQPLDDPDGHRRPRQDRPGLPRAQPHSGSVQAGRGCLRGCSSSPVWPTGRSSSTTSGRGLEERGPRRSTRARYDHRGAGAGACSSG